MIMTRGLIAFRSASLAGSFSLGKPATTMEISGALSGPPLPATINLYGCPAPPKETQSHD